mmetsp:Transcript_23561/g.33139  ORF Transcript_23561/g.33139 Transcript_23561/m.33139 type:complete len:207 (+) Transcript_23561:642-1262(+)
MNITKGCCNGEETVGNLAQGIVDLINLLRLGIEILWVSIFVVHAILFTTCNTQLHFQPAIDLRHALHIFHTGFDVFFQRLLGKVQHMRGKQRFSMQFEVALICFQQTIKPWKQVFGAMIGVQNHWHAILLCYCAHVIGTTDGTSNGSMEIRVVQTFPCIELRSTRRELNHDGRIHLPCCLNTGIDGRGTHAVHGGNGITILLGMIQ